MCVGTFRAVGNSRTNDLVAGVLGVEIGTGAGLADVSREGTAGLVGLKILSIVGESEIVIPRGIRRKIRVIMEGGQIDGCSLWKVQDESITS